MAVEVSTSGCYKKESSNRLRQDLFGQSQIVRPFLWPVGLNGLIVNDIS